MWRYALPGVAIVGAVIALFAGAVMFTGNQKALPSAPAPLAVSDRSSIPAGPGSVSTLPPDVGTNNPIDTRLPPPPDLDAAQKAATEASQALAAVQREREAERALLAKQAQTQAASPATPSPPAQASIEAERQARVQGLDQQIAQRNETLTALNSSIDQARQTLAGLQQQQSAEQATLTRLKTQDEPALTAQRDKLQSQIGDLTAQVTQQKQALDATRANVSQAQQAIAALHKQQARETTTANAVDKAGAANSFSTVQGIVEKLRRQASQYPDRVPPPPSPDSVTKRPVKPAAESPWHSLMVARQAISAGDTSQARVLLVSSQHALGQNALASESAGAGGFAAAQVSEALSLLDAGAPVRAMHYLDLAIANLSRTPQAAAMQTEQP